MSDDHLLDLALPRIGCDFNAHSLSQEPDDTCYYSFDREQVSQLSELVGSRVVLFDYDSQTEIVGCEAIIETFETGWRGEIGHSFWYCGFRARPIDKTWYWGPIPWSRTGKI